MSEVIPLDARRRRLPESSAAVTWLGHATALIELDGARVLTDPALRARIVLALASVSQGASA